MSKGERLILSGLVVLVVVLILIAAGSCAVRHSVCAGRGAGHGLEWKVENGTCYLEVCPGVWVDVDSRDYDLDEFSCKE